MAVTCAAPAVATPLCLPPVFDGGLRLHNSLSPRSTWLEPALRQHALCWSAARHPQTLRVVVLGSSAVFGVPLPATDTFTGDLTARLHANGIDATVFNLGWVNPYQLRDALVLDAALAYRPDLIIYPVTLSEFIHVAPSSWPALASFFRSNRHALGRFADDSPPGLDGALDAYRQPLFNWDIARPMLEPLRAAGTFVRAASAGLGAELPAFLGAEPAPITLRRLPASYDCVTVTADERESFAHWQDWNILAYLADVRDREGIPVVVVSWPTALDPVGDCYNGRFTRQAVADFNEWLRRETGERQLPLVDLSAALALDDFFDTLHVTAEGHRKIAERLYDPLTAQLASARAHRDAVR